MGWGRNLARSRGAEFAALRERPLRTGGPGDPLGRWQPRGPAVSVREKPEEEPAAARGPALAAQLRGGEEPRAPPATPDGLLLL